MGFFKLYRPRAIGRRTHRRIRRAASIELRFVCRRRGGRRRSRSRKEQALLTEAEEFGGEEGVTIEPKSSKWIERSLSRYAEIPSLFTSTLTLLEPAGCACACVYAYAYLCTQIRSDQIKWFRWMHNQPTVRTGPTTRSSAPSPLAGWRCSVVSIYFH